ncbi:MAG: endonuclease III, partial [Pseudorhodoplanes sp.]
MARKTTRKNAKSAGRPAIKRKAALKAAKAGKAAKRKPTSAQAEADQKALHGDLKPSTREEVTEAFRRFQTVDPAPKGELQHINPFTLLV